MLEKEQMRREAIDKVISKMFVFDYKIGKGAVVNKKVLESNPRLFVTRQTSPLNQYTIPYTEQKV